MDGSRVCGMQMRLFFVRHAAQQKEAGEQLLFKVALPPVAQVDSS